MFLLFDEKRTAPQFWQEYFTNNYSNNNISKSLRWTENGTRGTCTSPEQLFLIFMVIKEDLPGQKIPE